GVCDSATGACTTPAAPDGTSCDDGNACTSVDLCMAGACVGTSPTCDAGVDAGGDADVDADIDAPTPDAHLDSATMDADPDAPAADSGTDATTPPPDGAPGDSSSSLDASPDAGPTTMRGGCCHVAGTSSSGTSALLVLALVALAT